MPIIEITPVQVGVVETLPQQVNILTNDTAAQVIVPGYLNRYVPLYPAAFNQMTMALVTTQPTPNETATPTVSWYKVTYDSTLKNWSLVGVDDNVILPTIPNHIATYADTMGTLTEDPATAISSGNIQAGIPPTVTTPGIAGNFISYPSATTNNPKGSLVFGASPNAGNTTTTITNASFGQETLLTIPDPLTMAANFALVPSALVNGDLVMASGTTGLLADSGKSAASVVTYTGPSIVNHIATYTNTTGNIGEDPGTAISGGNIQAGLNGTSGTFVSYPSTAGKGQLIISAANNSSGNFSTTVSNSTAIAQSQVISIPDVAGSTGNFVLSKSVSGQTVNVTLNTTAPANSTALLAGTTNGSVMTSGTIGGQISAIVMSGASGGLAGGCLGILATSGTLSGTSITGGLVSEIDLTGATVNGGILSLMYGSYTASAPTTTDMSKTHCIYLANPTGTVLNSHVYLLGDAQYALEISSASTYISTPSTGTASGPYSALKVYINGSPYYILAASSYS